MKRASLGLGLVTVLLLGSLQLAGADSKSITDPAGDTAIANLDVLSATAGHKGKLLKHTVTIAGDLGEVSEGQQILLQMSTDKDSDCERELIWPPSGKHHVVKCGVGNAPKRGRITEVDADTLKFTFKEGAIGLPSKYGWRIETRECTPKCVDQDHAPDEDGGPVYVKHKLN